MDKFLDFYIEKFKRLNRSLTAAGRAPHKPVLLLAVIFRISDDPSCENDFEKKKLSEYFDKIWKILVTTSHKMDINAPFIHLKSEGFWHLKENNHASLDSWLFYYLQLEHGRKFLTNLLLEEYFWNNTESWDAILQLMHLQNLPTPPTNNINIQPQNHEEKKNKRRERKYYGIKIEKQNAEISFVSKNTTATASTAASNALNITDNNLANKPDKNVDAPFEDNLEELCLTKGCRDALNKVGIRTCEDFRKYNLEQLSNIPGIGLAKIRYLKEAQNKLRNQVHCKVFPENNYIRHIGLPEFDQYIDVDFLQKRLDSFVEFFPQYQYVGDALWASSVKNVLRGLAIFDFDPIEVLQATTLEYFALNIPQKVFYDFWDDIQKLGKISEDYYEISEKNIFDENTYDLCFTQAIVDKDSIEFLHANEIFTFEDYNGYVQGSHKLSAKLISFALWHRNNAFALQQFQQALNAFSNGKLLQLVLGEQDVRDLTVFKKRIGEKQTLENLAIEFDLTRERIRQISKSFDNLIVVNTTDEIPSNSCPLTALHTYLDLLFAANGGVIEISDLREKSKTWLAEDEDFNFILYFMKINFSPSRNSECLFLESNRCLQCAVLKNTFAAQVQQKRIIDYDQIRAITCEICSRCANGRCPISEMFIPTFFSINLQDTCVYDTEDHTLYCKVEYDLQKGSSKNVVKAFFTENSVMTFDEIFKQLLLYRPDMTERRAYGCIQRANLVLADRGRYMLKSSLPRIPRDVYQPIIDDIYEKIQKNSNALFSVAIVFKKYQKQLFELKCTTPYILFEILKDINPAGIRFIKCPYVTSVSNTENFSLSDLLEEYIAENGKTPLALAREFFCKELGISKAVFTISYNRADKLIVDDDNNLIHIDDLNITREKIQDIVAGLDALGNTETTTATKLYSANEASCLLLDITGPKMLFNILRLFEGDCFSFRYPQISKSSDNIVAIRQQLIDFVRNTQSFCTREQLEDYCKQEHLSDRNLYLTHEMYPELFNYLPSTWVHIETIGYNPQWIDQVSLVAQKVLDDASSPQRSYSYLDIICEHEDELPKLASDELFWTSTLVGEILKESGRFLVYGKKHLVFSAKNDKNKLNNFGDLCALLLDEEFGGAANLHDFSSYLRSKELISNADLHDSLLQGSDRIVIDGMEVYTKKEQKYAE